MYKPSGMTVVTAGLAALALFQVVWGSDPNQKALTTPRDSIPTAPQDTPAFRAALDLGAMAQLHSGAWRMWPAPVEEPRVGLPVAAPTPELTAEITPQDPRVP